MPNDELNQAIELIKQGQDEQAQSILETLIAANQQDLVAWSWYVKSCRTTEKRLEALKVCLHFNPDNQQILEAIRKLEGKGPPPPKPPLDSARTADSFTAAQEPSPYTTVADAEPAKQMRTGNEPVKFMGLDDAVGRPFAWYDVWWLALTKPNVDFYTALLQDPLATPGRAYWWTFLAALVTGLVSLANQDLIEALNLIANTKDGANLSVQMAIGLVVLIPIGAVFGILGLMLTAAISNLLAKVFGGTGNFARTVYLVGAYNAPFSIISGIVAIIPIVNCLSILLALYGFRLHIAAIEAAQRLNGARATLVILIPGIIFLFIFCILGVFAGQTIMNMPEFQRIIENAR